MNTYALAGGSNLLIKEVEQIKQILDNASNTDLNIEIKGGCVLFTEWGVLNEWWIRRL